MRDCSLVSSRHARLFLGSSACLFLGSSRHRLFSILARTHSISSWFCRPVTCSHWLRAPRSHRHQLNTFQSPCATVPWFPVAMRDYSLVLRRAYFLVLRDIAYSQSSLVPIQFPRGSVARSPARTGCGRRAATDTS